MIKVIEREDCPRDAIYLVSHDAVIWPNELFPEGLILDPAGIVKIENLPDALESRKLLKSTT